MLVPKAYLFHKTMFAQKANLGLVRRRPLEQTKGSAGRQDKEAMKSRKKRDRVLCSKQNIVRIDKHFKSAHALKYGTIKWKQASQQSTARQQAESGQPREPRLEPM